MSKGGGSQTATTSMSLPPWLENAYTDAAQQAKSAFSGAQPPPFDTYAPMRPDTMSGLYEIQQLSLQPNLGGRQDMLDELGRTVRGEYLYGGPGFDRAFQAAANDITPQVTSAFNRAGRMGGGAGEEALTRRLGDAFAGLYNAERQRQMGGIQMAPLAQALAYDPAMRRIGVGEAIQGEEQNLLNERLMRYNYPRSNATAYLGALSGIPTNAFATTTQTMPGQKSSMLGNLLGAGLSIAGMATGNPFMGMAGGFMGGGSPFMSGVGVGPGPYIIDNSF